jgi:hypothetical protein
MRQELADKGGIAQCLEGFAVLAQAQAKDERALRLSGAAARLHEAIDIPLSPPNARCTAQTCTLPEVRITRSRGPRDEPGAGRRLRPRRAAVRVVPTRAPSSRRSHRAGPTTGAPARRRDRRHCRRRVHARS